MRSELIRISLMKGERSAVAHIFWSRLTRDLMPRRRGLRPILTIASKSFGTHRERHNPCNYLPSASRIARLFGVASHGGLIDRDRPRQPGRYFKRLRGHHDTNVRGRSNAGPKRPCAGDDSSRPASPLGTPLPVDELAPPGQDNVNVSDAERMVSVASGVDPRNAGHRRARLPGTIIGALGGALIFRGATGYCPMYAALNMQPAQDERGTHVEQAFIINRSPEDLYGYWRNFENLPNIMSHLKKVRVIDDRRSHWVADAPAIAGGSVEWDAEIIHDEPNRLIAWRSLPDSQVSMAGAIRFAPALGDRGTEVHVFINYVPPAGLIGHAIATLFGESPRRQMRDDLRNFKCLMETGEIPTTVGQPRGTCSGRGKVQETM